MKAFALIAMLFVSSVALADDSGGSSYGTEDVIAAGGLTTIVGGCADARAVTSGENTDITYTEPCNYAPTAPLFNDHTSVFSTWDAAVAACPRPSTGYPQAIYNIRFQIVGYQCAPLNNDNGSSN